MDGRMDGCAFLLTDSVVCHRSGACPAGPGEEHHGAGPPPAAGGPRDGGRVHDLRQPLGGAQDPGGLPPSGAAAAAPAATPGVLQPAGGQRRDQRVPHGHQVEHLTVALTHCCQSGSTGTGDLCTTGGAGGHIHTATDAAFVAGETCGTRTGGWGEVAANAMTRRCCFFQIYFN